MPGLLLCHSAPEKLQKPDLVRNLLMEDCQHYVVGAMVFVRHDSTQMRLAAHGFFGRAQQGRKNFRYVGLSRQVA